MGDYRTHRFTQSLKCILYTLVLHAQKHAKPLFFSPAVSSPVETFSKLTYCGDKLVPFFPLKISICVWTCAVISHSPPETYFVPGSQEALLSDQAPFTVFVEGEKVNARAHYTPHVRGSTTEKRAAFMNSVSDNKRYGERWGWSQYRGGTKW